MLRRNRTEKDGMLQRFLAVLIAFSLLSMAAVAGAQQAAPATAASSVLVYKLGPDDKVRINVYGEDALNAEYQVGSDGNISFPLIGMVQANGLTVSELQVLITRQLTEKAINDPKVSIDVVQYRPFYILGEVQNSGQYPYRTGMTVTAAIATAGGFSYRANEKTVMIQRFGETSEKSYPLGPQTVVQPGDTIRVKERFF